MRPQECPLIWALINAHSLRNSSSQFGYFPLTWMNHSWELNNKINRIHEWALRVVYKEKTSTFHELLEKDNSVRIHIKISKYWSQKCLWWKNEASPAIMRSEFLPWHKTIFLETTQTLYLVVQILLWFGIPFTLKV